MPAPSADVNRSGETREVTSAPLAEHVSLGAEDAWLDQQIEAMSAAWERGESVAAEAVLQQYPDLADESAVRLIYEEVCLRRESGEDVQTVEVTARFPRLRAELERLLQCDRLMRPRESAVFPEVGERLGDFDLLAELGRGRSGRTFLAAQPSLADRPVVLKVTRRDLREHLSLARLQHTHIVPLYSEHVFADRGLRALCMPYVGGASLETLLSRLKEIPAERRRGRDLAVALDQAGIGPKDQTTAWSPFRGDLDRSSYVDAISRIGVCVAEALQYAHDHGLVHMDVKPANVLIAADGQPMLLDFHLARGPVVPGGPIPERLGGTPGWMSPEQRAAMTALESRRPITEPIDARSDVYSLGLLLYDALRGAPPTGDRQTWPRLDRCNPHVSVGLADIVARCLAPAMGDRYASAGDVAEDLRRHLNDLPLVGVTNRSLTERWRKWKRRRPHALAHGLAWVAMGAAAAIVLAVGASYQRQRAREVQTTLDDAKHFLDARQYAEAVRSARRGIALAERPPALREAHRTLQTQLALAIRGEKARELHVLMDRVRLRYTGSATPSEKLHALILGGRTIWQERGRLIGPAPGDRLDAKTEEEIKTDLMELALVWADIRIRLASAADRAAAGRDALRILKEVEADFGSNTATARAIQGVWDVLDPNGPTVVHVPPARTAWDHDQLGRSLLRSEQLTAAAEEFARAVELRPQDFWPNFYQGLCAHRLGQYEDALAAFRVCVTLAPQTPECYYNRALTYDALERTEAAERDYSQALSLDRSLTEAYLNRGLIAHKAGRYDDAAKDYDRALQCPCTRATRGRILYNLALVRKSQGRHTSALAAAKEALSLGDQDSATLLQNLRRSR
jgi:serine/threonine protein kinase/Flp pilus assembly protein TadD